MSAAVPIEPVESNGRLELEPLTGGVGAVARGLHLGNPTDADIAAIDAALLAHLVVVFPAQSLTPTELLSLARGLGEIDVAPFGPKHPEHPEMTLLDQKAPRGQGADTWHSDNTFTPKPPSITLLQAVRLPERGGDTCFADTLAAYEALSPSLRAWIDGLSATHDLTCQLQRAIRNGHSDADLHEMQKLWPPVSHPVVRTHPRTGRRALFVNASCTTRINELSERESQALLPLLRDHVRSPEFQCRVRWSPGALVMWDNRSTQHYGVADYDSRRVMHRLTLAGERPF